MMMAISWGSSSPSVLGVLVTTVFHTCSAAARPLMRQSGGGETRAGEVPHNNYKQLQFTSQLFPEAGQPRCYAKLHQAAAPVRTV